MTTETESEKRKARLADQSETAQTANAGCNGEVPDSILVNDPYQPSEWSLDSNGEDQYYEAEEAAEGYELRRPKKREFFTIFPNPVLHLWSVALLEQDDRDPQPYLIRPPIAKQLDANEWRQAAIYLAVNRDGDLFTARFNRETRGEDPMLWHTSAKAVIRAAQQSYVKMVPSQKAGRYLLKIMEAKIQTPPCPEITQEEWIKRTFQDRIIDSLDDPVLRRALGKE